ncbi:hypothetical protein PIB30_062793 [Stylosanthes scabra]|uniref:Uncharacterized protein n=1 Tax=Stylosanthes scabra TaxID=79078 RepID=A0ABU6TLX3_9FABA|nr:hypothetical protein [Stylosanthes scabra]
MQIYNRFDTYENTIHAVAGDFEITTEKIGKALGLKHTGRTNSIGSPLSPGQTCCHQVPKNLCHAAVANLVRSRNCHCASRGVGRIALRD